MWGLTSAARANAPKPATGSREDFENRDAAKRERDARAKLKALARKR